MKIMTRKGKSDRPEIEIRLIKYAYCMHIYNIGICRRRILSLSLCGSGGGRGWARLVPDQSCSQSARVMNWSTYDYGRAPRSVTEI